ncbi:uncharacterized protein LOC124408768 isoform X2 [Diprion similis]|uniref:uncharacterized protein LOC124408768 isoform X2 n=1 Tax=Diprion similis TaxID=362088 RepID=UPI001EF8C7FF|nr:uncharacterized protein LOC124408768 isoform X2 [Diprion similis]
MISPRAGKNGDDDSQGLEADASNGTKEVLVNIDCPIGLIMDYVRSTARLEEGEIDFCDENTHQIKNVTNYPCWARGTDVLVPGTVYFIVKVERGTEGRISRVLPLINAAGNKASKIAADIMSKIQPPAGKQRTSSVAGKSTLQEKNAGKTVHPERRSRVIKPASRDRVA